MWGHVNARPITDLQFNEAMNDRKLGTGDPTRLTFAFIIAASRAADITDDVVDRVDIMRRYWDLALPAASRRLLRSTSTL